MSLSPTLLQEISPAAIRGRTIAIGGIFALGFSAVTPLLVGIVSDVLPESQNGLLVAMAIVGAPALFISIAVIRFGEETLPGTIEHAGNASGQIA